MRTLLALILLLLSVNVVFAIDLGQLQSDTIFNFSNGVNYTILAIQNFSQIQYPTTPTNTLEFTINGSIIQFNSSANKTLYNITYSATKDAWDWKVQGSGYMNITVQTYYNATNYGYYQNTTLLSTIISADNSIIYLNSTIYNDNYSIQKVSGIPSLITPLNNSVILITTLPLTQSFTWSNEGTSQYNIQIARDTGFTQVVSNLNVVNNQTAVSLFQTGNYYWKVRTLSGVTYGSWSGIFKFTVNQGSLPAGDGSTGIQGIVYETTSTGNSALGGATIYISNATWTNSYVTGSDGYFVFTPLANQTLYSLQAKKTNYDDSNVELVTTINGTWVSKFIYTKKCTSGFNCYYVQQQVTFTVFDPYGALRSGVDVKVYEYGSSVVYDQQTTDTYGVAVFTLSKTQKYTFVFTSGSTVQTFDRIPIETKYSIVLGTALKYWNGVVWKLTHSNTTIYFNVSDPNSELTNVNVTFANASNSWLYNILTSGNPINISYAPSNLSVPYKVSYTLNSTNFGRYDGYQWINVSTGYVERLPLQGVSTTIKTFISIMGIITITLIGGKRNAPKTALFGAFAGGGFIYAKMLSTDFILPLVIMGVYAVYSIMRQGEQGG